MLGQTRKNAAAWCVEHHHPEEAFQYGLATGDFEFMADLLDGYLESLLYRWEIISVQRWLANLPRDVILKRPLLRLMESEFKIEKMQLVDAAGILQEIEDNPCEISAKYEAPKKSFFCDMLVYQKALLAFYRDMSNLDIGKIKGAIQGISPQNKVIAGYMKTMIVARSYLHKGDLKSAEAQMKKASADISSYDNTPQRMNWTMLMASIERLQGRLKQSEKRLLDALDFLKQQKLSETPIKYMLYIPLSLILFQRNEVDRALAYGELSLKYIERTEMVGPILALYDILSNICMAKEDFKKAMHYAVKSKSLSESLDSPSIEDNTDLLFLLISLHLGEIDAIKNRVAMGKPDPAKAFSLTFLTESMLYAVSLVYLGELTEAVLLLKKLRDQCAKRRLSGTVLEIDVFLSGISFLRGNKDQALKTLSQTLLFSKVEGYIRPFVSYAPLVFPLLKDFVDNADPISRSSHFKAVLKACDPIEKDVQKARENGNDILNKSTASPAKNASDLTKRELEILRFMADGYRNKQIADLAFISLSTVKTHINNIFKKLGAKSRLQAILKAKDFLNPSS